VGAHQVHVGLGDGGHADLVVPSGEEGGEGARKRHGAVPGGTADRHADLQETAVVSNEETDLKSIGTTIKASVLL